MIEGLGGQPKLSSLQYLRALAAIGVVLFHASLAARTPLGFGAYGVDIFFVISGFVMVWITSGETRPLPFLAARLRRIVPLYWIVTVVAIAAVTIRLGDFPFGPGGLGSSFLFLPYGPPGPERHYMPIHQVGWTLNYDMMFYAVLAAALVLRRPLQLIAVTAALLALAAIGVFLQPQTAPLEFWSDPIILHFLGGAWLAAAIRPSEAGLPRWLAVCAVLALLVLLPVPRIAILLVGGLVLLDLKGLIPKSPLLLLGDASYSIYLWHPFAIAACAFAARSLSVPPALLLPLATLAGIAIGLLGYALIEKPLLRAFGLRGGPRAARTIAGTPGERSGSAPADRT
jgi:exopolysaccharide production protein ExoZ